MKFSEKLIKLRKENKLSQEQLASKLDVSRQSVSKWESGQTYPEMDKLLAICKIFKCSLDDLTNDEISKEEMSNTQNKKNSFINLIYEMLEFINKSISMLKAMSFKEIIKMLFLLFLLFLFLLVLRVPFIVLINLGSKVLTYLHFSYTFNRIWEFLITTIYLILFVIIFIYIYKVRYLDKFEETEEVIIKYIKEKKDDKDTKEEIKPKKEIKVEEKVIIKKDKERSFALFIVLGNIMKYFIKFIIVCVALPLVFTLALIAFFLVIDIILMFKGVIFIGILLGLIFALLFNYMIIEVMFKFIFNMSINFKKIFIMFIVSVIGIGVSVGIFTLEATTLKVYDEIPKEIEMATITKEFDMHKDSYLFYDNYDIACYSSNDCEFYIYEWEYNIIKEYDESLDDKVKLELTYTKDYTELEIMEENHKLDISKYSINNYNTQIELGNIVIKGLKDKKIYNYDFSQYHQVTVVVTTSKKNHELLDQNQKEKINQLEEQRMQDIHNSYQEQINNLENQIDDLNDQIYELQNTYDYLKEEKETEIEELKIKLEEKEQELQEYKDRISELLDE